MARQHLTGAALVSGAVVDVTIDDGPDGFSTIVAVEPSTDPAGPGADNPPNHHGQRDRAMARSGVDGGNAVVAVDLRGWMLLPAPVEPHAHLDKAFLAETVPNPTGDLMGAIDAMTRSSPQRTLDHTIERAERAARLMAANGYVAVRSHLDLTISDGLANVEALTEVRRRVADVIDIELVALVGIGITGPAKAELSAMLRDALAMGVDRVGGCPHLEPDSQAATDILLSLAAEHGVGVDLHTDETLDPDARGLDQLVAAVEAGFGQPVTASHCVALGQRPLVEQHALAERVAAADVSVVSLPHTNLFLQGRGTTPTPRALTAVDTLVAAGVNVAAGADNLQDPFNPIGRACPFETAALMVLTAHVLPDDAWAMVSERAATALGRPAGIAVGKPANLLAVQAGSVREAIAYGPERRRWRSALPKP